MCAVANAYNSSLVKSTLVDLTSAKYLLAGASVGDYALFAGGKDAEGALSKIVDVYDSSLVKNTPIELSKSWYALFGVSTSNFAVFGGGIDEDKNGCKNIDAFDKFLVKTIPDDSRIRHKTGATVGNYVLLSGGGTAVDAYVVS